MAEAGGAGALLVVDRPAEQVAADAAAGGAQSDPEPYVLAAPGLGDVEVRLPVAMVRDTLTAL
jgi:hypothetical protein